MKRASLCLLALTAVLASGVAQAKNAQQDRMKSCNAQAAGKTGAERKAFMNECLQGEAPSQGVKATSQQQKMKDCNEKAGDKKGADRQAFMTECLKKH
jgi:hypothetical protein